MPATHSFSDLIARGGAGAGDCKQPKGFLAAGDCHREGVDLTNLLVANKIPATIQNITVILVYRHFLTIIEQQKLKQLLLFYPVSACLAISL